MDPSDYRHHSLVEARDQLRRAAFAAIAWMSYDTLLSLDDEVQYIWSIRMSWVTWVYLFVRYTPILHALAVLCLKGITSQSTAGCRGWIIYELAFVEVLTLVVEIILVIRIYVLYNQRKWVLCVIVSAFLVEVTGMIIILGVVIPAQKISTTGCLIASSPNMFLAYWLTALAFEIFLFALTLVQYLKHVRRRLGRGSVLCLFFRDGSWAFAMIFTVIVINALTYKLDSGPLAGSGYLWAVSVLSFSGSHVLLNLRKFQVSHDPLMYSNVNVFTTLGFRSFDYQTSSFHDQHGPRRTDGTGLSSLLELDDIESS